MIHNSSTKKPLMLGMRIVCVILAIIIWVFVVNVTSDEYEKSYIVSIKVEGTSALNEKGMSLFDLSQTQVTVTVKGNRADLISMGDDQFRAYVDVSNLADAGKHTVDIDVRIPDGVSLVSTKPEKIDVYSDETQTKEFRVDVILENYSITKDYEIESKVAEIGSTSVTGPASVLKGIDHINAVANLGSMVVKSDFSSMAKLVPVNEKEEVVQDTFLTFADNMMVNVTVNRYLSIPLSYSFADGFDSSKIEKVNLSRQSLDIIASSAVAESLTSLNILTITQKTEQKTTVSVSDIILPKNAVLTDKTETIEVTLIYKVSEETTAKIDSGAVSEPANTEAQPR